MGCLLNDAINNTDNQGYTFDRIDEFNIITIADKMHMTHDFYIKNPMQMIERRLNVVIDTHPQLKNALDRNENYLLIRKDSHIPFNN